MSDGLARAGDLLRTLWRGAWIGLWHVVFALPSAPLVLALGARGGELGHALFARLWGRLTLLTCGVPIDVEGRERLRALRGPYVLVANHGSELDFYALSAVVPGQWRALMRPGLGRIPVYGWTARRTGHVFVSQSEPGAAIDDALAELARGHALLVFAEGRRPPPGTVAAFKRGAFVIAARAGVPVVPVAVREVARRAEPCLGRALGHRIERLRLSVLEPVAVASEADPEAVAEEVRAAVTAAHDRIPALRR